MGNDDLRDLLKSGYDTHAAQLRSGDDFAARHHGNVSRAVGRRRIVRQAAVTGGALASVSALAVAGAAVVSATGDNASPLAPSSTSTLPSQLVSPSPSPSPSPSAAGDPGESIPEWVPAMPTGAPQGDVVDDDVLRLVSDAQAPAPAVTAPTSVACGDPAAEYVAPILVDASARILRPDTTYPTFLDPSYVPQEGDLLVDLQFGTSPAKQFFVSVSLVNHEGAKAWVQDAATGTWSGGESADYNAIAQGGVLGPDNNADFATDDVDFLYGAVVVQDGVIVGHADLWSPTDTLSGDLETALSTINEVSARDASTQVVYDYGVGPLEHVLWCSGSAPAGPVDTYAVVGTRSPGVVEFDYTMLWAGAVEYK